MNVKKKNIFSLVFILLLIPFLFNGCRLHDDSFRLIELHGHTMGTLYMIKIVNNRVEGSEKFEEVSRELANGIDDLLKQINLQMSTWLSDSEISRFNRFRESDWFEISPDTARVIDTALRVSEISQGAFDITVGPLVNLWGFGPQKGGIPARGQIPTQEEIDRVMATTGYHNLSIRLSSPAVSKRLPNIYCDLSAIAKGFGVDKTGEFIESLGFTDYLVEIGGEVRARGVRPDGQLWRVAVVSPDPGGSSPYRKVLLLKNFTMATSGDYFNYFEKDGIRFSHTIDPTTGKPITHKLASVTVMHESCMYADAMATAIDVLGPEKGYELALKEKLPVFMIIRGKDTFIEKMTPEFTQILK